MDRPDPSDVQIEARRGFFQGHRPDLDLPSVAEAKARGKPPDAGPPKDVGQPPNPG